MPNMSVTYACFLSRTIPNEHGIAPRAKEITYAPLEMLHKYSENEGNASAFPESFVLHARYLRLVSMQIRETQIAIPRRIRIAANTFRFKMIHPFDIGRMWGGNFSPPHRE